MADNVELSVGAFLWQYVTRFDKALPTQVSDAIKVAIQPILDALQPILPTPDYIRQLQEQLERIETTMVTKEQVDALQAKVDTNNTLITEIGGDIDEVITKTDAQAQNIKDLEEALANATKPDDPEVVAAMEKLNAGLTDQQNTLTGIAGKVPEPVEPPPPPPPPPVEPPV